MAGRGAVRAPSAARPGASHGSLEGAWCAEGVRGVPPLQALALPPLLHRFTSTWLGPAIRRHTSAGLGQNVARPALARACNNTGARGQPGSGILVLVHALLGQPLLLNLLLLVVMVLVVLM